MLYFNSTNGYIHFVPQRYEKIQEIQDGMSTYYGAAWVLFRIFRIPVSVSDSSLPSGKGGNIYRRNYKGDIGNDGAGQSHKP